MFHKTSNSSAPLDSKQWNWKVTNVGNLEAVTNGTKIWSIRVKKFLPYKRLYGDDWSPALNYSSPVHCDIIQQQINRKKDSQSTATISVHVQRIPLCTCSESDQKGQARLKSYRGYQGSSNDTRLWCPVHLEGGVVTSTAMFKLMEKQHFIGRKAALFTVALRTALLNSLLHSKWSLPLPTLWMRSTAATDGRADSRSSGRWDFLYKALYIKDERRKGSLCNKINSYLQKERNCPLESIIFLTTNSSTMPLQSTSRIEKRCNMGWLTKEGIKICNIKVALKEKIFA